MATLKAPIQDASITYSGSIGSLRPFGGGSWQTCRVSFHEEYHKLRLYKPDLGFMYVGIKAPEVVVQIMSEVEDNAKVPEADRLQFRVVESKNVPKNTLFIDTGEWWGDPVRFTLLTALLRDINNNADIDINSNNTLEEVITSGKYLSQTPNAIRHFLKGKTYFWGNKFGGWVKQFAFIPQKDVEDQLKDEPSPDENVIVSHHPGWPEYMIKRSRR